MNAEMAAHGFVPPPSLETASIVLPESDRPAAGHGQLLRYAQDLAKMLVEREAGYRQLHAYVLDLHRVLAERDGAREAARAADASKKQFLATMSHEFRTPLTAILGFSEYLAMRESDEAKRDLVQRVIRAGHRIDGLVDKLLTLARLEFGGIAPEPVLCDCVALVRQSVVRHEAAARAKGLHFTLGLPQCRAMPVVIDGARLAQALDAIVDNAVKFTQDGSVSVALMVDGSSGLPLRIEVTDTGPGIGENFQPRLFSPFEQEDGSSTRAHEGAGIGLATAAGLMDLLGGQLNFRSAQGSGSVFSLELPYALPERGATLTGGITTYQN